MAYYEGGPLVMGDGTPVVPPSMPHNCYFPSKWREGYSHKTVATILTNERNQIAVVVERRPDEPAEGGKLVLPGGYVDLFQRVIDAAEAEVLQETGYSTLERTLARFAFLDGPTSVPGRRNEHDGNIVTVFTAQAGEKVGEHDEEVTGVSWIDLNNLPDPDRFGFGHFEILGMWARHLERPFPSLPIYPSEMSPEEVSQLYLPDWPVRA